MELLPTAVIVTGPAPQLLGAETDVICAAQGFITSNAVSYTHLDVYKRQRSWWCPGKFLRIVAGTIFCKRLWLLRRGERNCF